MQAEVAYILKGYPRLSETFISQEIYLLESMGLKLRIYSIKQSNESQQQGIISLIKAPLFYCPQLTSLSGRFLFLWLIENFNAYAADHYSLLKKRPMHYLKTLGLAVKMMIRYRKSRSWGLRKVFIKEFLQAGHIALRVLGDESIHHLHAHFCHGATSVALFVSNLTDIPYSFTAHAKDIYQDDQNPGDLLQYKIKTARFVTTCTGANLQLLSKLTNRKAVHKIYHGLDINHFKPLQSRVVNPLSPVNILSVGRYVSKKGFVYLLEACQLLRQRGYRFHCRIIGEHGDHYRQLKAMQQQLGLLDCVSLDGPITHEKLVDCYQNNEIFVLPCQVMDNGDRDGIPNALMEAMACGMAVVSTNISGIPELIKSGVDGLLVQQKNSQELANTIERLITDTHMRTQLGLQARKRICLEFDASNTNQRLFNLFTDCIQSQPIPTFEPCQVDK